MTASHRPPSDPRHQIRVTVETEYLADQSDAASQRWVFAYHITILNEGTVSARLLTRHWVITDGEERVQEVHGEGVIGEQPHLAPGQSFRYTSGAVLETEVGSMRGSYQMIGEDGIHFDADIPAFTLAVPHALH
ncbi:MAG: Co2+/Mg2+ efflux protein ApaG [Alcanivoracaceae bacterium]|uniref:Protein ApaG n=1 Tax=Alcanivorax profundi TaxID=2338368 RepID=A0A418XW96_9GAMM|nr:MULTISPECIES: Co2+/Mg2+ efflux protein ApaG [Alcanivorax]MAX54135.1 Co2+/Mg2+ efflux protein ApaG [Alcanivoracaceae bacterium]MED5431886.1 Co2+/Mg2+ efflux protein ApaG [Pseudomonadota bacterium]ERP91881.1 magnesium transporter ApaG [Alcanivorax sp. P2S70]MEE2869550.1 Co2+/Mg2+ efflux protein ApaG [Pseudomonadota bacterium]PNE03016.1 ApaG protein [Alcanivorax sp. MD8A]|tara:strand:+ start:1674 stop:2075 length:402 start_codon:yes stop_codon:yes gene_type:complete